MEQGYALIQIMYYSQYVKKNIKNEMGYDCK